MKRWELIFKALANSNRLKIIKMLQNKKMNVGQITEGLDISFVSTSRHLVLLRNFEVIQSEGKDGHVFYFLNPQIPPDFKKVINLI